MFNASTSASTSLSPPHRMRLVVFKPLRRNSLRGFADIELPNGLRIAECLVLSSHGKAWATFPGKPQIGRDGAHIEIDGKKQYSTILYWRDRDTQDRWSEAVVALVRAAHPEALA